MLDELKIGDVVAGRFRIEALLGHGGSGTVYRAQHTVLRRQVALKLIRSSLIKDEMVAARFRREARAASSIDHPNVTAVFDFGHTPEGLPYLVMEYVDGVTLQELINAEGPLPLGRVLPILGQIAEAIAAAHARGIIHRDLKPQNVLLTTHRGQSDVVKILDFGLAKIADLAANEKLSLRGEVVGTPQYMSPEQCTGQGVDFRTDIYAFGSMAFAMLAARPPFVGTAVEMMMAHVHKEPSPPSLVAGRDELAPEIDGFVLRCLRKDPGERFASITDLAFELRRLQAHQPQHLMQPTMLFFGETQPGFSVQPSAMREAFISADVPDDFAAITEGPPIGHTLSGRLTGQSVSQLATVVDGGLDREALQSRRRLQEIACVARDRGLGGPELSQALAAVLIAEKDQVEIEYCIELLQFEISAAERLAQRQESLLQQALAQLEDERRRATEPHPSVARHVAFVRTHEQLGDEVRRISDDILTIEKRLEEQFEQTASRVEAQQIARDKARARLAERVEHLATLVALLDLGEMDPPS